MNSQDKPDSLTSVLAQTGFRQQGFRSESLHFREIDNRSLVRLRALPAALGSNGAMGELPVETGQCAGVDPVSLCLRPGEWLVMSEKLSPEALCQQVGGKHDPANFFAWDESDALSVIHVSGAAAAWLLRKHCGLELSFDGEAGPYCARTKLAHINVLIHYYANGQEQAFDLYVERGLAPYLWELLVDSAPHAIEMHANSCTDDTD